MKERFQLDTLSIPWGIRCLWYLITLVVVGPVLVLSAIDLDPTALLWLAAGAVAIGGWEWWTRRTVDPERNYVELDYRGFEVEAYAFPWPTHQRFKYGDVASVNSRPTHGIGLIKPWPRTMGQPHVDIRLKRIVLVGRPIPFRWVTMLHLAVQDPDTFVRELQARLRVNEAASG